MDSLNSMSIYELATSHSNSTLTKTNIAVDNNLKTDSFALLLEKSITRSLPLTETPASMVRKAPQSFLDQLWVTKNTAIGNNISLEPTNGTEQPIAFVNSILEPAQKAADQLGTSTAAVIAVAAHETGWGKHVIDTVDSSSSHNLFGIKARNSADSAHVLANTTEFINGVEKRVLQPFRTYDSVDASVADFADFLQSNPRYNKALNFAHDPKLFIENIHDAGYATDPDYATKVNRIMTQVEQILLRRGQI